MPPKLNAPYLLVADDDRDDVELFGDAFTLRNPAVPIASVYSGKQLIEFLEQCSVASLPTLLLLDYQLHDASGPEILTQLRSNPMYKQIVKVMWSTSRRVKDMEDCKKLGAAHYFVKPSGNEELEKIIADASALFSSAVAKVGN
jgi:CheY-like chemotaxis protein